MVKNLPLWVKFVEHLWASRAPPPAGQDEIADCIANLRAGSGDPHTEREAADLLESTAAWLAEAERVVKAASEFSDIVWRHGMQEQPGPIQVRLTALLKVTRENDVARASRAGKGETTC